jgi:hypothetical protein
VRGWREEEGRQGGKTEKEEKRTRRKKKCKEGRRQGKVKKEKARCKDVDWRGDTGVKERNYGKNEKIGGKSN